MKHETQSVPLADCLLIPLTREQVRDVLLAARARTNQRPRGEAASVEHERWGVIQRTLERALDGVVEMPEAPHTAGCIEINQREMRHYFQCECGADAENRTRRQLAQQIEARR